MKKIVSMLAVAALLVLMATGSGFNALPEAPLERTVKQQCFGYTVLENSKGLNCKGDTVTLVKRNGFFQIASLKN
jgi:hypothetical protein